MGLRDHFRNNVVNHVIQKMEEVMIEGSGFTMSKIDHLLVQFFKYEPLRGPGYIQLPIELRKKAVLILKNTFDEFFKWSVLSALHYDEVYAKNRKKANDADSYRS